MTEIFFTTLLILYYIDRFFFISFTLDASSIFPSKCIWIFPYWVKAGRGRRAMGKFLFMGLAVLMELNEIFHSFRFYGLIFITLWLLGLCPWHTEFPDGLCIEMLARPGTVRLPKLGKTGCIESHMAKGQSAPNRVKFTDTYKSFIFWKIYLIHCTYICTIKLSSSYVCSWRGE